MAQIELPVRAGRLNGYVWLIVALTGVVLMGGLTLIGTPPPMISPDSGGYLNWDLIRTPGYPFFLSTIRIVDPDFGYLPYVQMAFLIVSVALLAEAAALLGGPWWIWVLMGAGILGNPFLWRFAWQMQTESLFISLVAIFLGCIAMALRSRPRGLIWLLLASTVLGAAILVNPVGYALLGVAPAVGLTWRGRHLAAIVAASFPAIAVLISISAWNFVNKGYFATQIFGGYNILGQIALLITPDIQMNDPVSQEASKQIARGLSHVRERLPQDFGSWQKYFWMMTYAYNPALYGYALPAITDAERAAGVAAASPVEAAKRTNARAWNIALATIKLRPAAYIYQVAIHFVGLWTLPALSSSVHAANLRHELCAPEFQGFYCESGQLDALRVDIPAFAVGLKDGLFFGLMVFSFLLILAVALRSSSSPLMVFAAVAALCVNAHHLLVALVEAGVARYAMVMWPELVAMVAGTGAWALLRLVENRRRPPAKIAAVGRVA